MLKEATELKSCMEALSLSAEERELLLNHVDSVIMQAHQPLSGSPQTAQEKRRERAHAMLHVIAIIADIQFVAMTNLHLAGIIKFGGA